MNVESQKKLCVTCIFGFIVLLVIIIIGWFRWPAPKLPVEDPHRVTLKYDERDRLVFEDAQGNLIVPVVLDKDNSGFPDPIRALLNRDRTALKIEGGAPFVVLDARVNPRCRPMIISGNLCVAPHTYCCQPQ